MEIYPAHLHNSKPDKSGKESGDIFFLCMHSRRVYVRQPAGGIRQDFYLQKREVPLSYMPPPEPLQPDVQIVASSDPGSCKEFSKSGSNTYIDMWAF